MHVKQCNEWHKILYTKNNILEYNIVESTKNQISFIRHGNSLTRDRSPNDCGER